MASLERFIKQHSVDKGQECTHTSIQNPARSFYVSHDKIDEFYTLYDEAVSNRYMVSITEKPPKICPLIIDLDMKFRKKENSGYFAPEREYTIEHIKNVIRCYHQVLKEILEEPPKRAYRCIVLEKPAPRVEKNYVKDGVHLHFPYVWLDHWVQQKIIRPRVIEMMIENRVFVDLEFSNTIEDIIDAAVPRNNWLLLGSCKGNSDRVPYMISKIYDSKLNEITLDKCLSHKKYPENYGLARKLSIRQEGEQCRLKSDIMKHSTEIKETQKQSKIILSRPYELIMEDLRQAGTVIDMLPDTSSDDYHVWMQVGYYLYNIAQGLEEGLRIWRIFSMRSKKYKNGECETKWKSMEIRHMRLSGLVQLVKKYNPNGIQEYNENRIDQKVRECIKCRETEIAALMYFLFGEQFKCADIEKNIWFEFRDHRWHKTQVGIDLKKKIRNEIVTLFYRQLQKITNELAEINAEMGLMRNHGADDVELNSYVDQTASKSRIKKDIDKAIDKLNRNGFKNAIMKEAFEFFYDDKFIQKLDENPHLTVFNNGVYDSKNKIFRDGEPGDYCSKSTGIDFIPHISLDDPRVVKLLSILRKSIPDKQLFEFFRQTSSDFIFGGNRHKIFLIWSGIGDNGKSIVADMLEQAFGDYFYTPPTELLTGKRGPSGGATPELIQLKGARVVCLSETGNNDVLNCGMMKKLTGGDPIYARGLFKDPVKIKPQFKVLLHCNQVPNVNADDKASWNRIRLQPWESRFVRHDDPELPETESEQYKKKIFPKDPSLKNYIESLAPVLMRILIQWFEEFGDNDLYEPDKVMFATHQYRQKNDYYAQFVDEKVQKTDNPDDVLSEGDMYSIFKVWYKDFFPNRTIPTKIQLADSIYKKLGFRDRQSSYRGYRIKEDKIDDDFDDNGSIIDEHIHPDDS